MLKEIAKRFKEVLSPVPVAKPTNLRVPTQTERIMAYVRAEQIRAQQDLEIETFEEADDFEIEGEEWMSPYEEVFAPAGDDPLATVDPPAAPGPAVPPSPPVATET